MEYEEAVEGLARALSQLAESKSAERALLVRLCEILTTVAVHIEMHPECYVAGCGPLVALRVREELKAITRGERRGDDGG